MAASAFSVQPQLAQAQVVMGVTERHKAVAPKRLMEPFIRISLATIERAEACSGISTAGRSAAEFQFTRETGDREADERVGGARSVEEVRQRRQMRKRWVQAVQRV